MIKIDIIMVIGADIITEDISRITIATDIGNRNTNGTDITDTINTDIPVDIIIKIAEES